MPRPPEAWRAITSVSEMQYTLAELKCELSLGHPLPDLCLRPIARHVTYNVVLFAIEDGSSPVASVHLSWSLKPEKPPWPYSLIFDSILEWSRPALMES